MKFVVYREENYNICVQILEIKNKIIIKIKGLFFLLYLGNSGIKSTTYPSYALNLAQLGALCISNLCATKPI